MSKEHHYNATVTWTGNRGEGTSSYEAYDRQHIISVNGRPDVPGSSDAAFRGDPSRYSPEDSFVAAVSACHMLWYLHLCSVNHVIVQHYVDTSSAVMVENSNGSGQFRAIVLKPEIIVSDSSMIEKAKKLHEEAHEMCFLARSLNFPVYHQAVIKESKA